MAPNEAPAIDPVVRGHVENVLRQQLMPGELDDWELRWLNEGGQWQLVVDVVACGEPYLGFVTGHEPCRLIEEGLDIFTDGFEDFIAESRFAWGQQRELKERPWRAEHRHMRE